MPNAGNVDFSTAIVYDYEIVGIKRFTFNVMRLKIWNKFSNVLEKSEISLKFSGYDP
jgi:hypothetical protein